MKKHSSAIKSLREKTKSYAAEGAAHRATISRLTWKDTPEAQEALRTVRAARKAGGRQTLGKRFLKPHRRPETGPDRYVHWNDKRGVGWDARHCILAMGLLKEMPYSRMEPGCHDTNKPSCSYILDLIHQALGDNEALKAEWTQEKLVELVLVAQKKKAA